MPVEVELRTWQIVAAEVIEESDTEKLYELIEELNRLLIEMEMKGIQQPVVPERSTQSTVVNPDPIILCGQSAS
jgi:hypothetical protein